MTESTPYSAEIAESICSLMAEEDLSLTEACAKLGVPRRTARSWIERNAEFEHAIEIASRLRVDAMVDDMVALADSAAGKDAAGVNAVRLAVDTRRWVASKLLPKRYGDRVELTGAEGRDLIPTTPAARVPQLMAVLQVLLPAADNGELHQIASALLERAGAALPAGEGG